ncbi:MAG: GNAT family N-acetyltransferase [Candidatus Thorarchaeota archaeon]
MILNSNIYIEIARLGDSQGIHNVLKQNLVEIRDLNEISQTKRKKLEDNGFLRKEVDIKYYKNLIKDPNTDIYVAKNKDGTILGFASIHKKKHNIIKVRDNIGNLSFKNERIKNLLLNEDSEFSYLEQISILPEYKRKGIGTALLKKALLNVKTPIVAFIVEKPLFNKASLDWHIYNNFTFSGISEGEYKGKEFKFQIFIYWNKFNNLK